MRRPRRVAKSFFSLFFLRQNLQKLRAAEVVEERAANAGGESNDDGEGHAIQSGVRLQHGRIRIVDIEIGGVRGDPALHTPDDSRESVQVLLEPGARLHFVVSDILMLGVPFFF
jgi:hypothetical protein